MRGSRLEDKSNLPLDHTWRAQSSHLAILSSIEEAPREFSIVPAEGKIGLLYAAFGTQFPELLPFSRLILDHREGAGEGLGRSISLQK